MSERNSFRVSEHGDAAERGNRGWLSCTFSHVPFAMQDLQELLVRKNQGLCCVDIARGGQRGQLCLMKDKRRLRKPDETAFGREPLCKKSKVGTARKNRSRETDRKDTTECSCGKAW